MLKQSFFAIILILFLGQVQADQGRGGGDPHASEFLVYADRFCSSITNYTSAPGAAARCKNSAARIRLSLNDKVQKAEVEFTDKILRDSNGVLKPAIVETASHRIYVNRKMWTAFTEVERFVISAMEISLVSHIPDRYSVGSKILESETSKERSRHFLTVQQPTRDAQCTSALNFMADNTRQYRSILLSCREIQAQTSDATYQKLFTQYGKVARSYEKNYDSFANLCNLTCDDTSFCESKLQGACR